MGIDRKEPVIGGEQRAAKGIGLISLEYEGSPIVYREKRKKQNKLQGSSLFCSKRVLGLEINEVIRGITTNTL